MAALDSAPRAVWIASVAGQVYESELRSSIAARWDVEPWFARSSAAACGVTNSYTSPERMGVDRWLAMIAAWQQARGAVCVVDAGSALTIDFLDSHGVHTGGYILPGLRMMERALLEGTDRVRFGDAPRDCLAPGNSTETAVLNGLQLAQVGAVELALTRFGQRGTLVFTGGNFPGGPGSGRTGPSRRCDRSSRCVGRMSRGLLYGFIAAAALANIAVFIWQDAAHEAVVSPSKGRLPELVLLSELDADPSPVRMQADSERDAESYTPAVIQT